MKEYADVSHAKRKVKYVIYKHNKKINPIIKSSV